MKVSLVGAGPGDPGLLTLKGKELLEKADVVIYDALANPEHLAFAKPDAELIYVGKIADKHALPQNEINLLLVEKAKAGKNVVRLKGGDPYIFGRGGEEGEILSKEGISWEEIPGISSAIAAPAYAGIPVTHRDFTSSITIITGHESRNKEKSALNWKALATGGSTLVFVMGVKNLAKITESLIEAGLDPETPAAIIYRGTTPFQRKLTSTVSKIACDAKDFTNPSVIVIGKVVSLNNRLDWFIQKPLLGKTIIVTRAREQASQTVQTLADLGAYVLQCPAIKIEPLKNYKIADSAIGHLQDYDWIIFTSVNGVKYFWQRLNILGYDTRRLGKCKVAAIGPATAEALEKHGVRPDFVPDSYVAEGIIKGITQIDDNINGKRILIARAKDARMTLPDELAKMGAFAEVAPIYQTVQDIENVPLIIDLLEKNKIDCISFGSSSTVRNFLAQIPVKYLQNPDLALAAIGPITAQTLRENNLKATIRPREYTIPGLIKAIVKYFENNGKEKGHAS